MGNQVVSVSNDRQGPALEGGPGQASKSWKQCLQQVASGVFRPWVLIFLIHAGALIWWTLQNGLSRGPQNEFHQLLATAELHLCLVAGDWDCVALWTIQDYHPPLHRLGGTLALLLLPGAEDLLVLTNLGWMFLLIFSCWRLGLRLSGTATGTVAAALAASYPAMVGSYHYYELNVALVACCALSYWAIAEAQLRPRAWFWAGGACALAMLADRFTAIPFVGGAALACLGPALLLGRTPGATRDAMPAQHLRRRGLRCAAAFAILPLILLTPWFLNFLQIYMGEMLQQLGGEITFSGRQTEQRSYSDPSNWIWYPLSFALDQLGLVCTLAAGIALPLFAIRARGPVALSCLGATLGGLTFFTLILKKQPFYVLPALPALAVATAWAVMQLRRRPRRIGLILMAGALLQLDFMATTGRPLVPTTGALGLLGLDPLVRDGWKVSDVLPRELTHPRHALSGPPDGYHVALDGLVAQLRLEGWTPEDQIVSFSDTYGMSGEYLYPMELLRLRSRNVEELMVLQEGFLEAAPRARWFVYVSNRNDRPWPTRDSLEQQLGDRELMLHADELWQALEGLRRRAGDFSGWEQGEGDRLFLYPLAATGEM